MKTKYYEIDCMYDNGSTLTASRRNIIPAQSEEDALGKMRQACRVTLVHGVAEVSKTTYDALLKERADWGKWNNNNLHRWQGWQEIAGAA
jgi:hypothetical protein